MIAAGFLNKYFRRIIFPLARIGTIRYYDTVRRVAYYQVDDSFPPSPSPLLIVDLCTCTSLLILILLYIHTRSIFIYEI